MKSEAISDKNRVINMRYLNKKVAVVISLLFATFLSACNPADTASRNLSLAADNFEIQRRVVFYNGITGDYILSIEGLCSIGNYDRQGQLTVTYKVGPNSFEKHFLGLSDNVTYFAQQMDGANVSTYHNRIIFRPQSVLPDFDLQGDVDELINNKNTDG